MRFVLVQIEVAYALPEQQWVVELALPAGATVTAALQAVAHRAPFSELDLSAVAVGVYGEVVERDRVLNPFDRVELYRPLLLDPKTARRRRAEQQSAQGKD